MILYSFQPLHSIIELIEKGCFNNIPDPSVPVDEVLEDFYRSYDWLRELMLEKNVQYIHQNKYMVWAYSQWSGEKNKEPNRRYNSVRRWNLEDPFVLLTLNIDKSRVFETDYHYWHFILNKVSPLEILCDNEMCGYKASNSEMDFEFRKVSNIKDLKKYMYDQDDQVIQATFFDLLITDLIKVELYFNGKKQGSLNYKNRSQLQKWFKKMTLKLGNSV